MTSVPVDEYRRNLGEYSDNDDSETDSTQTSSSDSEEERYSKKHKKPKKASKPKSSQPIQSIADLKRYKKSRGIGMDAGDKEQGSKRGKNGERESSEDSDYEEREKKDKKSQKKKPWESGNRGIASLESVLLNSIAENLNSRYPEDAPIRTIFQYETASTDSSKDSEITIKLPLFFEFNALDARDFDKEAGKSRVSEKTLKYIAACAVLNQMKKEKKLNLGSAQHIMDRADRTQFIIREIDNIQASHNFPQCSLVFSMTSMSQAVLSSRHLNGIVIPPTHGQAIALSQKLTFHTPWSQYKPKLDEFGKFSADNLPKMISDSDNALSKSATFRVLWMATPLGQYAQRNAKQLGIQQDQFKDEQYRIMDGNGFKLYGDTSSRLVSMVKEGYEQLKIPKKIRCSVKRSDGLSFEEGVKKWLSQDSPNDSHTKSESFLGDFSVTVSGTATVVIILDE